MSGVKGRGDVSDISREITTQELSKSLVYLRSDSTSHQDRLIAIRKLFIFLQNPSMVIGVGGDAPPVTYLQELRQAILDSAMKMILSEDRMSDLRRRQLIRTELFMMIAQMLKSSSLFSDVSQKFSEYKQIDSDNADINLALANSGVNRESISAEAASRKQFAGKGVTANALLSRSSDDQEVDEEQKTINDPSKLAFSITSAASLQSPGKTKASSGVASMGGSKSSNNLLKSYSSSRPIEQNEALKNLQNFVIKRPTLLLKNKKLRPRGWVLTGDDAMALTGEGAFAPGTDPLNWIEQDKKLGYQKQRMWFPNITAAKPSLLPDDRHQGKGEIRSDRVVEEYLQMKAMISYMGDIVLPKGLAYNVGNKSNFSLGIQREVLKSIVKKAKGGFLASNGDKRVLKDKLEGVMNEKVYNDALHETAKLWSPLMGVHLPDWIKARLLSFVDHSGESKSSSSVKSGKGVTEKKDDDDDNKTLASASSFATSSTKTASTAMNDLSNSNPESIEKSIMFTKETLRKLLRKEFVLHKETSKSLRSKVETFIHNDPKILKDEVDRFSKKFAKNLDSEYDNTIREMEGIKTLMQETVKLQYSMLPSSYLLIVEGGKAKPRELISKLLFTFLRVKRRGYLALAFGIWKIGNYEKISMENRPKYARTAACHLIAGWVKMRRMRRIRLWITRWARQVTAIIFHERNKAVVPIQCMYRVYRERRKFISLFLIKPVNGPLSDIKMAPHRKNIRYRIPKIIRDGKRVYWNAAIIIQSRYRTLIDIREYRRRINLIILVQSFLRMVPKRCFFLKIREKQIYCAAKMRRTVKQKQFRRLKRATIVIQKYVRRYLCILHKHITLDKIWQGVERKLAAICVIQQKYSSMKARKRIKRIIFNRKRREWAALVMQRQRYKTLGKYHTFFLMACYRVIQQEDIDFNQMVFNLGRFKSSRKIVWEYKKYYRRHVLFSVVKVQCWWRGRQGYTFVFILKKRRWASRKLRHWARGMMKKKHALVRKIQNVWLHWKRGRAIKHIHIKARKLDKKSDRALNERKYKAACAIQAIIKGVWCRRFIRRTKAAMKIQKPLRFFLARKRWKREKRELAKGGIYRYVNSVITRAVMDRTAMILRKRSQNFIKVQKLVRGFIIRSIMSRARAFAFKFGLAVVTIQRFWRKTGAMAKAVQEILALKRMDDNPFKVLDTSHLIFRKIRQQSLKLYHNGDPRVGLRVSSFLYRLGCMNIAPMFPRKEYLYVLDMMSLTMDKLVELYTSWKSKADKSKDKNKAEGKGAQKAKQPPKDLFKKILELVNPPLFYKGKSFLKSMFDIMPIQELYSPTECNQLIIKIFAKKFGKTLQARAQNLGKTIVESFWTTFSGYKSLLDVVTLSQINKAVNTGTDSAGVAAILSDLRDLPPAMKEDEKWEIERITKCATLLELAADKCTLILPPGPIVDMVEKVRAKVAAYKRKYTFLIARMKLAAQQAIKDAAIAKQAEVERLRAEAKAEKEKGGKGPKRPVSRGRDKDTASDDDDDDDSDNNRPKDEKAAFEIKLPPHLNMVTVLGLEECLELPFQGPLEGGYSSMEMNINICKLYFELFDKLYIANAGIHMLKRRCGRQNIKRMIMKQRLKTFLAVQSKEYIKHVNDDHVKIIWKKFRRKELIQQKMKLIFDAIQAKRIAMNDYLSSVTRFGWNEYVDDNQYPYYVNDVTGYGYETKFGDQSTYDRPVYTKDEFKAAGKIGNQYKKHLAELAEAKRLKDLQIAAEIAEAEAKWLEANKEFSKTAKFSVSLRLVDFNRFLSPDNPISEPEVVNDIESFIPWKLKFEKNPNLYTGVWALMESPTGTSNHPLDLTYDVVVILKIGSGEGGTVDVRSRKGKKYTNVKKDRIVQMNLDKGMKVEARYSGRPLFYKGKIVKIIDSIDGKNPEYNIIYDDGEKEDNITRDLIRPDQDEVSRFLVERRRAVDDAIRRKKRFEHFQKLKFERLSRNKVEADAIQKRFSESWSLTSLKGPAKRSVMDSSSNNLAKTTASEPPQTPEKGRGRDKSPGKNDANKKTKKGAIKNKKEEEAKPAEKIIPLSNIQKMIKQYFSLCRFAVSISSKIVYTRRVLRYGWIVNDDGKQGINTVYLNVRTKETTRIRPAYSAAENYHAQRIIMQWRIKKARKLFLNLMFKDSADQIVKKTIMQCRRIAWIGYRIEGLSTLQYLQRTGFFDLAEAIEGFYRLKKISARNIMLRIEKVAEAHQQNDYEAFGILSVPLVKRLREFQVWYKRYNAEQREHALKLMNYYKDSYDNRTIQQCIADSEEVILAKFMKVFPTGATKTQTAVKIVVDSIYPHTHAQIDNYIKKYSSKATSAQEFSYELLNKPTTDTWKEEAEVFKIMRRNSRKLGVIMSNLKLKKFRDNIQKAEDRADGIMKSLPKKRELCSGAEAKAALILRVDVFDYVTRILNACRLIQKRIRGFAKRRRFIRVWTIRKGATITFQRVIRGFLGRRFAAKLLCQYDAEWEQLYDQKRNAIYFFNRLTGLSRYDEPRPVPPEKVLWIRPLVRDRFSAKLMQAWPWLEKNRPSEFVPMLPTDEEKTPVCYICDVRNSVKVCMDCIPDGNSKHYGEESTEYCFPCFTKAHGDNPSMKDHRSKDSRKEDKVKAKSLSCCICGKNATRKCMGILEENQIDEICGELQRSRTDQWLNILVKNNVGGESKLVMLLDQIKATNSMGNEDNSLSSSNLQQVRMMLERTRAECDECYCTKCYTDLHSGGKRTLHRWLGFAENSRVCAACTRSPSEVHCSDCSSEYCNSCFKVFHAMGKKRKHKKAPVLETLLDDQIYCQLCERRAAFYDCDHPNCDFKGCDSCLNCMHVPTKHNKSKGGGGKPDAMPLASSFSSSIMVCVACGQPADQKCVQCNDFYCSRTWMGNPGCFVGFHSKGKRVNHQTQKLSRPKKENLDDI